MRCNNMLYIFLSKKRTCHSRTFLKILLLIILVLIFELTSVPPVNTEEDNTEEQIKKIRTEFTIIEKSSLGTLIFVKDTKNTWKPDDGHTEAEGGENFQQARLYIDEKGAIRKLEFLEEDVGLEYTRKEYFWPNGELFFVHAEEMQGGSGNWWEARLYFYNGKIIRNLAAASFLEQMKEYSPVTDGQYIHPDNIDYHLHTKDIQKEFGLD